MTEMLKVHCTKNRMFYQSFMRVKGNHTYQDVLVQKFKPVFFLQYFDNNKRDQDNLLIQLWS